jgi:MFS transporter, DHA1 family, inner membrane transport protein
MENKHLKIFILLAAVNFTHILDFMILMPLGNYLMPQLNINTQEFSLLIAAYAISAGVSSFISAFFVNQFDRKRVLIFAYTGFLIGTLACGLSPNYEILLVSRVFAGVFGGMIGAQVIAIISDLAPFEKRGQAMGIVMSSFAIASTLGIPIALYLSKLFNWHAPFIFIVSLGVIILVMLFKGIPSMSEYKQESSTNNKLDTLTEIFKHKKQYLALLFSFSMFMGHFIIIPFINPFLEFNKGFTKDETPLVYLFGGLSAFITSFVIGKASDSFGKLKTFILCTSLSLPLVILVTRLPDMPLYLMLSIFSVWFAFSTGRSISSQSLVSNVSTPQTRGSFQSFNSFVQQIGSGAASLIAGMVVVKNQDQSLSQYEYLGYISFIVLAGSIFLGYYIFKGSENVEG